MNTEFRNIPNFLFICLFETILYLFRGYVSDVTYVKGLSSHEFWPNGKNY